MNYEEAIALIDEHLDYGGSLDKDALAMAISSSAPAVDALTTEAVEGEHRHLGHELQALIHWAHDQGGYWVLDKCQPELDALVRAARKEGMPPLDALKFNNMPHSASEPKVCPRCGGYRCVPDSEITGCGGVEFENGPIQCVKDCHECTAHPAPALEAPAVDAQAVALPMWFDSFLMNVAEIPDRNSPEDEPDAMIATAEELRGCALNAIENTAVYTGDRAIEPDDISAAADALQRSYGFSGDVAKLIAVSVIDTLIALGSHNHILRAAHTAGET